MAVQFRSKMLNQVRSRMRSRLCCCSSLIFSLGFTSGLCFWGASYTLTAAALPQSNLSVSDLAQSSPKPPSPAQTSQPKPKPTLTEQAAEVGIEPALLENSPVLRRWLQSPPDLMQDIQHTPVFSPHIRTGITSRNNDLGVEASIEDVFVGQTPFTLSGSYQTEFAGREQSFALQMRYYTLPLGSYFNVAPTVGYRQINLTQQPQVSGVDLGLQGVLVLSPHAADLRIGQTFTAPGAATETGITTLAASYAITTTIRLHSRAEWRRNPGFYDQRFAMGFEIRL